MHQRDTVSVLGLHLKGDPAAVWRPRRRFVEGEPRRNTDLDGATALNVADDDGTYRKVLAVGLKCYEFSVRRPSYPLGCVRSGKDNPARRSVGVHDADVRARHLRAR